MGGDFEYKSFKVNRKVYSNKFEFVLNQDIIVPDIKPDILEVLHRNANIYINRTNISNNILKINGTADVEIMYMADNETNDIRGLNTEIEINESVEIPSEYSHVLEYVEPSVKSIECRVVNERKVMITLMGECNIELESNQEISYVGGVRNETDMQYLNRNIPISNMLGNEIQTISVNEEICLDIEDVCELLESNVKIVNQEYKLSYNKILVKADANISLILITNNNNICTKNITIPLTGFIDMQGITENSILDIKYNILNKNIKLITNGDDKYVSVNIEVSVLVKNFENSNIDIIEDMYSLTRGISFDKNTVGIDKIAMSKHFNECVNECIVLEDIDCEVYSVMPSVVKCEYKKVNDKLHIEGEIKVELMSKNMNKIFVKNYSVPFTHIFEDEQIRNSNSFTIIPSVQNCKYNLNNNKLELNVYICFKIIAKQNCEFNAITNIVKQEEINKKTDSITIYYVKQGDTLWKIAKRFLTTIDEIAKYNEFNIDSYELKVGEQLFIPKKAIKKVV
ncbi:MAG: DUF3794 domain-containing protein [Clostridiales bacterium]|nr:DUF3794 domain-containing protein [Clostridiales bacterium]